MSNEKLDPDAKPMNVHAKLREAQEQLRESRRREMDLAEACRDACMERDQAIAETAEQCAQVCDKLAASIFTTEKILYSAEECSSAIRSRFAHVAQHEQGSAEPSAKGEDTER